MERKVVDLEINEEITGKARPRMSTRTGKAYTPTKTKNYEYAVRQLFVYKYSGFEPLKGRLRVSIIAYVELPKKRSRVKEAEMLSNIVGPTKKPDIDNIAKIILDSLNKFAYEDDKQITKLEIEKKYARTPRVVIKIEEY